MKRFMITPSKARMSSMRCATDPELASETGRYYDAGRQGEAPQRARRRCRARERRCGRIRRVDRACRRSSSRCSREPALADRGRPRPTMHFEGDVPAPAATTSSCRSTSRPAPSRSRSRTTTARRTTILDWGVWAPDGFPRLGRRPHRRRDHRRRSVVARLPARRRSRRARGPSSIGKAKLDADRRPLHDRRHVPRHATLPVLPKATYAPVMLSTERRWYKGDFHVHSIAERRRHGDVRPDLRRSRRSAASTSSNISDHNTVSQHALLAALQPSLTGPPVHCAASRSRRTAATATRVGITSYVDHRIGLNGRTIANVIDDVRRRAAMFIVNHPVLDLGTACIGCAWKHVDDTPWDQVSGDRDHDRQLDIGVQRVHAAPRSRCGTSSSTPGTTSPRSAAATITPPAWTRAPTGSPIGSRPRSSRRQAQRGRDHRRRQHGRTIVAAARPRRSARRLHD